MSDTVKKLHLTPWQMQDAVARAAEDVKTLPPWRETKETTMADKMEDGLMSKRNMGENVKELRLTDKQVEAAIKRAEANQKNWTRWPDKPKETTMSDKTDIGKTIRARREAEQQECHTEVDVVRGQLNAALAELAALKKRIAESPIGAVEVYEVQRYVGGKRVAVKLPESFEHGAVVRVVRVLAEDTK